MSRNKLLRYRENLDHKNIVQPGKEIFDRIKGCWRSDQFENNNPIVVELACGRGEFSVGLAAVYPDLNFIGVDIKGSRLWKGSKIAIEQGLENVAFLRAQIQLLDKYFEKEELSEIWITFPDPYVREGDEKRRLTYPKFLEMYKVMLKKGGIVHLKTDNTPLFDYTFGVVSERKDCEILAETSDFDHSEWRDEHFGIKTKYEKIFSDKGEKIKYLKFRFLN